VAHPLLPARRLDAPVSYEGMEAAGAGLGAAGFVVFDDATDLAAVAAGVARFLGVESCGQCTPCKQDGLALASLLSRVCASEASGDEVDEIRERLRTVTDGARCFLAHQHQRVVESITALFPEAVRAHTRGHAAAVEPELIAPIVDIRDGEAILDERHRDKQPDWTYDAVFSGQSPADRIDQPVPEPTRA
jgi:NADH-quinone oxidoreductase subunit F